tara:strand:- start:309 stop:476 length:168 start_codon:yes stop_codon:yes gene_type:complete
MVSAIRYIVNAMMDGIAMLTAEIGEFAEDPSVISLTFFASSAVSSNPFYYFDRLF